MRFLVDARLPPALAGWLRERGYQAEHLSEIGLLAATDATIANYAEANVCVLVTKDEDFATLRLPDRFSLLWLRCGNATNRALMAWLTPRWSEIERLLSSGERFVEAR
jgi:predicted nuclease of predicted toxin-antitoxin system